MPTSGRPCWQPSLQDREVVRMMTAVGLAQEQICRTFQISKKTLRKHCRQEIDCGAAEANLAVGRSMYALATRGPYSVRLQAARYWLAARGGWRDGDRTTVVMVAKAAFEMDDEELREVIAREEAHQREVERAAAAGGSAVVPFPKPPRGRV
jgi:hypothetical protein